MGMECVDEDAMALALEDLGRFLRGAEDEVGIRRKISSG
jgi:hypothetical protein